MSQNRRIVSRFAQKVPLPYLQNNRSSFLHPQEEAWCNTLPEYRQYDFLSGRFLLKKTCTQDLGIIETAIRVTYKNHKPQFIWGDIAYNCSISHSTSWVAISYSEERAVGIDIEEVRPRREEFVTAVLNNQEKERMLLHVEAHALPTVAWTLKEAALKADTESTPVYHYEILNINETRAEVLNTASKKNFMLAYFSRNGVAGANIL